VSVSQSVADEQCRASLSGEFTHKS